MSVKVTIIMSVFNDETNVKESVESVLVQTLKEFEFIIIDDGSTDSTPGIISSFRDDRIKTVRHEHSLGLTRSLNEGIKLACGKYIARQDAGDISLPERLEKQYDFLEKNPAIALIGCGVRLIYESGREGSPLTPETDEIKLREALAKKNRIFHSSIMFRNFCGISYREKFMYSQDYDLYLRLLSAGGRIINMPDVLIRYRVSPKSISYSRRAQQALFAEKAREFHAQRSRDGRDLYDDFKPDNITSLDVAATNDPKILAYELKAGFELEDRERVRHFYLRYFRAAKTVDKNLFYFLASFLPFSVIRFLKGLSSQVTSGSDQK